MRNDPGLIVMPSEREYIKDIHYIPLHFITGGFRNPKNTEATPDGSALSSSFPKQNAQSVCAKELGLVVTDTAAQELLYSAATLDK